MNKYKLTIHKNNTCKFEYIINDNDITKLIGKQFINGVEFTTLTINGNIILLPINIFNESVITITQYTETKETITRDKLIF